MRDGRTLDELETELGIVLILVSGPEAVIRRLAFERTNASCFASGRPAPKLWVYD
jgi:hypothetical protein